MLAFHLSKFVHLIAATGFIGVNLMNYLLVARSLKIGDCERLRYTLKSSLIADMLMPLLIAALFITGVLLVDETPYTFHTPWIQAAFLLLALSVFFWFANTLIKMQNFRRLAQHNEISFLFSKSYHIVNIVMFALLLLVIHDAVMRHVI